MELKEILSMVDHTNLKVTATESDIRKLCKDAMHFGTASVCIAPCFVKLASQIMGEPKRNGGKKPSVCTVIGFPNGYNSTCVKVYETSQAIMAGAEEIDMVVNISDIKSGNYENVLREIQLIKQACDGSLEHRVILKVIIETCLLTTEEKIKMCEIVSESGADFIKTSTGFSIGGATREDIALFKKHIRQGVGIKAAGGISSLKDAEDFIMLGANRLGTSKLVEIAKGKK